MTLPNTIVDHRARSPRALVAVMAAAAALGLLGVYALGTPGPAAATLAVRSSRIGPQPASAVGVVSARRGNEIILTTASGRLDRLALTPTTTVAKLVDADPDGAVTGTHLAAEG